MINSFKLSNMSEFVASIRFIYWTDSGEKRCTNGSSPILPGLYGVAYPTDFGVPDGATCALCVETPGGRGYPAEERFVSERTGDERANYTITGTARCAELEFDGVTSKSCVCKCRCRCGCSSGCGGGCGR